MGALDVSGNPLNKEQSMPGIVRLSEDLRGHAHEVLVGTCVLLSFMKCCHALACGLEITHDLLRIRKDAHACAP